MPRRITMQDIARHLGVDQSTISLALRNHARISESMKEKVRRAAEELGYKPDPMLNALASYRQSARPAGITAELAWINRCASPDFFHSFREYDNYWRGAVAAARDSGYRLESFNVGDAPLGRLERMLHARNIGGLVIPPHHGASNEWSGMDFSRYSIVRIGHSVRLPVDSVGCDQTGAAILGFHNIHERGYKRIGFVTHHDAESSTRFRAGFLFAQENTEGIIRLPTLLLHDENLETARRELGRWVKQQRPDAIFTPSPRVRGMLADLGLNVPRDIALAGTSVLDGNVEAGLDQQSLQIGRNAIEMLGGLMAYGHRGIPETPRMTTIGARWVDGASLPPRPASNK